MSTSSIFISEPTVTGSAAHFCFVDEGVVSGPGFETYLRHYTKLFTRLTDYSLVYVAANRGAFEKAGQIFQRNLMAGNMQKSAPLDPETQRLLEHFRVRQLFESREFRSFNQKRLIQFRADRREFASDQHERLFSMWKEQGSAVVVRQFVPESAPIATSMGTLVRHYLPFDYNLFGSVRNAA